MKRHRRWLALALPWVVASNVVVAEQGVLKREQINRLLIGQPVYGEGPYVSPTGGWVAYEVLPPPTVSRESGPLPDGTPADKLGGRIEIYDVASRRVQAVPVPSGASAWDPSWSPDGRMLAFYSNAKGFPRLWVYAVGTPEARPVGDVSTISTFVDGAEPKWSPDGTKIYIRTIAPEFHRSPTPQAQEPATNESPQVVVLSNMSGSDEEQPDDARDLQRFKLSLYGANITSVELNSGQANMIVPIASEPHPTLLQVSPSGKWISYINEGSDGSDGTLQFDLAVVRESGGSPHRLVSGLSLLPRHHALRSVALYAWHPEVDRLLYVKDRQLWIVDFDENGPGSVRRLAAELGPVAFAGVWFTQDGRGVIVATGPSEVNQQFQGPELRTSGLAVVPLDGGMAKALPAPASPWRLGNVIRASNHQAWQPDGRSLYFQADIASGEERKALFRCAPDVSCSVAWQGGGRAGPFGAAPGAKEIFGIYEDYSTPPGLRRFSADFRGEHVALLDPELERLDVGPMERFEVTIPRHDGRLEKVLSTVLLPPGAKRGDKLPAVVFVYPASDMAMGSDVFGGGYPATVPAQSFCQAGFAVVLTNMPMGPASEPGHLLDEFTDTVLPQVYRAAELGYIDIERVALAGQSGGGYLAAGIPSRTRLFRASIAINGFFDLAGVRYGKFLGLTPVGARTTESNYRMGTHPWGSLPRYLENSPYYQADKIVTPLLIVHGDQDGSFIEAQMLFTALRRLDRPVEMAIYKGQGHVISNYTLPSALDAVHRMTDFLEIHLRREQGKR